MPRALFPWLAPSEPPPAVPSAPAAADQPKGGDRHAARPRVARAASRRSEPTPETEPVSIEQIDDQTVVLEQAPGSDELPDASIPTAPAVPAAPEAARFAVLARDGSELARLVGIEEALHHLRTRGQRGGRVIRLEDGVAMTQPWNGPLEDQ